MGTVTKHQARTWIVASLALVAAPAVIQNSKACCLDDNNGIQAAATGLGQASPPAANLSSATAWRVYEFEREGIRYLQVNGSDGTVRVAIGYIGDTFWTLPMGVDAVSTPQRPLAIPASAVRSIVYQSPQFDLVVYSGSSLLWAVEAPAP